MAILRKKDIKDFDDKELNSKLKELKTQLNIQTGKKFIGVPENIGKMKEMKRTIAKILTEQRLRFCKLEKTSSSLTEKKLRGIV